MEFVRPVDWEHPHVTLEGGYKGQYLYAGESCLIVATKVPPGVAGPPRHRHPSDQTYFVVQGEISIELGAKTETAQTRSAVFIPAGLPHHNWNDGSEDEVHIEVIAPGILPVQPLVEFADLQDTSAQPAFIREADPARLTGQDFGLDWLYFVLQGTLSVEIGLQRYDVPPGHLVILPAQVPHRQWNDQDHTEQHLTVLVPEPTAPSSEGQRWDTAVELQVAAEQID
jgi:quercetin dioxygenase-like cupin family protein